MGVNFIDLNSDKRNVVHENEIKDHYCRDIAPKVFKG